MSTSDTPTQHESLGFLIADISRLMRQAFHQQIQGCSLTLAQAKALLYISRNQGIRQVEVADLLEIKPMTLARLIDVLAAENLVERRPDATDRRAYCLYLLPDAAPLLEEINRVITVVRAQAFQHLAAEQRTLILQGLNQIHHNLSDANHDK